MGTPNAGYFYDAQGNVWSAADWPGRNVSQQVTLVGTELAVAVGTNQFTGDTTPVAYFGVTQVSAGPTFALQGPDSISVGQGPVFDGGRVRDSRREDSTAPSTYQPRAGRQGRP